MKSDRLWKHAAIAFAVAFLLYAIAYKSIEDRRTRQGPWEVVFTNDVSGAPALVINQPKLAVTNVQISFSVEAPPATNFARTIIFSRPAPVPFELPLGKCVFMDTTFLPGTIVLEIFGHEIQLIPRVLTIDKQEVPWQSNARVRLSREVGKQISIEPTL
jgi:hypothetical protein